MNCWVTVIIIVIIIAQSIQLKHVLLSWVLRYSSVFEVSAAKCTSIQISNTVTGSQYVLCDLYRLACLTRCFTEVLFYYFAALLCYATSFVLYHTLCSNGRSQHSCYQFVLKQEPQQTLCICNKQFRRDFIIKAHETAYLSL